jgi:hypothetical protein
MASEGNMIGEACVGWVAVWCFVWSVVSGGDAPRSRRTDGGGQRWQRDRRRQDRRGNDCRAPNGGPGAARRGLAGGGGRSEADVTSWPGITAAGPTTGAGVAWGRIWGKMVLDKWAQEREIERRLTVGHGASRVTSYRAARVGFVGRAC